jgi:DUF917 family protein
MVKCKRVWSGGVEPVLKQPKDTLAVITDVIDQNWVLADGRAFPGGMMRAFPLLRLSDHCLILHSGRWEIGDNSISHCSFQKEAESLLSSHA